MAWLIQRRAPQEPTAVWGSNDRWIPGRHEQSRESERVPEGAAVFHDWDIAHQIAEWLRTNQPLAYGEVIALVDAPETA